MTDLSNWQPLGWFPPATLEGNFTRLERLTVAGHAAALHAANPTDAAHWAYMPYGPYPDLDVYRLWAAGAESSDDPVFYAIHGPQGWGGVASFMRIDRSNGVIEIGNIALSPGLQRTPASTEAIHLMIDHAFAAGFRRVEWKCNAENAVSRRAALRYGFTYEGTFRQHMVVKAANRDTAWFAIVDGDWPRLRAAHRAWLDPENFDTSGRQKESLAELTAR
ncbi:Protein N-acetyltransferase, RimJ/RimL family [Jannaschia faecimaris]|uniref:Protein N-acetyltransferase, RimJ/RimL family n=1 Tax=Jannaschia faecimaris TaxID=1244108 RepID=A0A1H3MJB1_9RHOB|nr:GNAT family protein [Jannaschia faecimaris]SDY76199.1 Protein N-acetyltransferase, RimJ/RimL family [Jannaschia faecimaris]